jgi:hypothetical protein
MLAKYNINELRNNLKENNMSEIKETTKIQFTNCYGTYSIEMNDTDMDIDDVVINLVKPLLLAVGYHPNSVADALGEDNDEDI